MRERKSLSEKIDLRICDCENCTNTQTYREFIRESEKEFNLEKADIDNMDSQLLSDYFDFLDELWLK